jgi:hypothetical protein
VIQPSAELNEFTVTPPGVPVTAISSVQRAHNASGAITDMMQEETEGIVNLRWDSLSMFDHYELKRSLPRFKPQAKLILDRSENHVSHILRLRISTRIARQIDSKVIPARETGSIQHRSPHRYGKIFRELLDRGPLGSEAESPLCHAAGTSILRLVGLGATL